MYSQSGRAMDHVHHEQARHSSRGSLVRAKAGKVAFVMRMLVGVIMRMLMRVSDHENDDTEDESDYRSSVRTFHKLARWKL